jgi:serine/threonine-protein kinase HipA
VSNELIVLLEGREVGRVRKNARGGINFLYDDEWRKDPAAYPISLSMPLGAKEHGRSVTEAFLWGLLPDNEQVLERWAKKFQVSARNVFSLLSHVGEDCAGAVQFVLPERLKALTSGKEDKVEWLDETDMAKRLQAVREDHAAGRLPGDTGQFSLAGAQPKTALLFQNGRWGVPSGRIPTTHILKPPTGQFDGHAENEHVCLDLARELGLPTAQSKVMHFGKEVAIVVERYDRLASGNDILRVHQEDACQARGIMPTKKYQNEGGPSAYDIAQLIRAYSTDREADLDTFFGALAFNWLIVGTDAHAKNYSLLLMNHRVRLAPLYDIASILPYRDSDLKKAKFAMKIGGKYEVSVIGLRQWERQAKELRIESEALIERIDGMAQKLPDLVNDARTRAEKEGLKRAFIERLAAGLIERASECRRLLEKA